VNGRRESTAADDATRFDSPGECQASPLFSDAEREICDIASRVASEHCYRMSNIGSDRQ